MTSGRRRKRPNLVLLVLGLVASNGRLISAQSPHEGTSAQELANQANNPAAPITLLQFRNILLPDIAGADSAASFPAASHSMLGSGKWEAGPAVAAIYTGIKNLQAGAVLQNPFSFAGSSSRSDVNQLVITPTFTYNLKEGWFAGMSDYDWTFNWESGGDATLPLGVQVGRVIRVGKQPIGVSIEAGGAVASPSTLPNAGWIIGFEFTPIFHFQIGRGESDAAPKSK